MEFVHGDVLVKSFPGYNIARLQEEMYEEMLAMSAGTEFEVIILNLQAAAAAADDDDEDEDDDDDDEFI